MKRHITCFALFAFLTLGSNKTYACGVGPQFTLGTPTPIQYSDGGSSTVLPATLSFPAPFHGSCNVSVVINGFPFVFQNTLHNPQTGDYLTFYVGSPFWFTGTEYMTHVTGTQGQTVNLNIPISLPPNQLGKGAGTYQSTFTVQIRNTVMGGIMGSAAMTISAAVQPSCTLPPPSVASLDFSSGILNGRVQTAITKSLSFSNAGCTGPARISLSSTPMKVPTHPTAELHFTTTASLGGSVVTLDTRNAASAFNVATSAPPSGPIPLSVTLLPTSSIVPAGSYSAVLKVSLEPAQ